MNIIVIVDIINITITFFIIVIDITIILFLIPLIIITQNNPFLIELIIQHIPKLTIVTINQLVIIRIQQYPVVLPYWIVAYVQLYPLSVWNHIGSV